MRKWPLLLMLALLFSTSGRAEEVYYTNRIDPYYHSDPDCDRPAQWNWRREEMEVFYQRDCYQKYEISEEAALKFDRRACPECVECFAVYAGDHMPEWSGEGEPWQVQGVTGEEIESAREFRVKHRKYEAETNDTLDKILNYEAKLPEEYGAKGFTPVYPENYGGRFQNRAGGWTYGFLNSTRETVDAFRKTFGGGAWIISVKYGHNEMMRAFFENIERIKTWCKEHPDLGVRCSAGGVTGAKPHVIFSLEGENWKQAAAEIDAEMELPIFVAFQTDLTN